MVKKEMMIILGIMLALMIIPSSFSSKLNTDLIASNNERIKVIVTLEDSSKGMGILSAENNLESLNITHKFSSFNGFSAELSQEELERLVSDNNVKSIRKVGISHIFLQDSAPLINASITWATQIGSSNLTGHDVTVCFIDTGINYSHPDLGGCYGNSSLSSNCKVWGGYDYANSESDPIDDHGHGTMVGGIIAANTTTRGIAPNARIIAIKACNSSGECANDHVLAGFEWCINNATKFNISVISLSLGSNTSYSSYCDSIDSDNNLEFAAVINNATSRNITVVVASGNSASTSSIKSPACIKNATAVGATTKADLIASYSDRSNITDLLAPGSYINSTYNGSYAVSSGTSFATPHVAGAVALLAQFSKLSNGTMIPRVMVETLNNSGKQINDSTSFSFSRIDIYAAILSANSSAPIINFSSPQRKSYNSTQILINFTASDNIKTNSTWFCNLTANITYTEPTFANLSDGNHTLYFYANDYNGNLNSTTIEVRIDTAYPTLNISSPQNSTYNASVLINITNSSDAINIWWYNGSENITYTTPSSYNFSEGGHFILVYVNDSAGNVNWTNVSFAVDLTAPEINFSSESETNGTSLNRTFIVVNCTSANFSNLTIYLYNSTGLVTQNSSNSSSFYVNFSSLSDGRYYFNATIYDSVGNRNYSETRTVLLDTKPPAISISSPYNRSWYDAFRFNLSIDEEADSCWCTINNSLNISLNKSNSTFFYHINTSATQTTYAITNNVTFYCNDTVGFSNSTTIRFFGIDATDPTITSVNPPDSYSTTTSTSIPFQFNASDNLNLSSCSLVVNNFAVSTTTSLSSNSTMTISYSSSTAATYTWKINCTDVVGNQASSASRTITLTAPASSSSSSSSSSGSSSSVASSTTETSTQVFSSVSAGTPITMTPSSAVSTLTGLKLISITTNSNLNTVEITASSIDEATITDKPQNTYKYFSITATNLNETSIQNSKISFDVDKSWIDSNAYDRSSVKLSRYYNNLWTPLNTTLLVEISGVYSYEAITPGFSIFAITADKLAQSTQNQTSPITSSAVEDVESTSKIKLIYLAVLMALLLGIVIYLIYSRKDS